MHFFGVMIDGSMELIVKTVGMSSIPADLTSLEMGRLEVPTGKSTCDISDMTCGPVGIRSTIWKQLDGCVTTFPRC